MACKSGGQEIAIPEHKKHGLYGAVQQVQSLDSARVPFAWLMYPPTNGICVEYKILGLSFLYLTL